MTGIILVAGYGSRLGDITKNTPKCLLDISGKCSLGRMIEALEYSNVKDITLVTGFQSHVIQEFVWQNYDHLNIKFVKNEEWETTNNAFSLRLALENIDDDILVLNGDVVCYKDLIKTMANPLLKSTMAVVRKKELNEEDMKVIVQDQKVIKVSKELPIADSFGEFTGIFKMRKDLLEFFKEDLDVVLKNNRTAWFEHALVGLCEQKAIYLKDVSHYPYNEIDFPEDLEEARDRFPYNDPVWEQGRRHESIKEGKRNIDDAIKLMVDFRNVLDKYEIRYWLNWGLLLGCVREGQPLKFDTDLDICIDKKHEEILWNRVVPEMRKLRCYVPDREEHCDSDCFIMREGEAIECNIVEKIGNMYVYSPNRCNLYCPEKYLNELDTIIIKGYVFRIPKFVDDYLEGWYGNWKTPSNTKPKSFDE